MRIDVGVTGGQPNLLGSLTAAARPLPENADWHAFGTSHDPENCGKAWPWQACNVVGDPNALQVASLGDCDVYIYAPNGGFLTTPPNPVDAVTIFYPGPGVVSSFMTIIDDNTILLDFPCADGWPGIVIEGLVIGNNSGPIYGTQANPVPVNVTINDTPDGPVPVFPLALTEKPLNPGVDAVRFKPFLAEYNAASCPGGIAIDWDQLEGRARRGLPVRTSNVLAQALSSSLINGDPNDSPNLPTLATDITPGGGPGDIVCTLAGLLQDAKDCGLTGEAFIHAPAWVLPLLLQQYLITQVGSVWKMGPHTIVLDEGFTNEAPVGSPAAAAGQAWFYITGPVEVATGSVNILTDQTRGVTVRENTANVMAAQLAIYRFDPCCVFAALVQVC